MEYFDIEELEEFIPQTCTLKLREKRNRINTKLGRKISESFLTKSLEELAKEYNIPVNTLKNYLIKSKLIVDSKHFKY